jgi:hypothetical protein
LLLRELQPTLYREVVLTSFPSVAFLNNTLMEHYHPARSGSVSLTVSDKLQFVAAQRQAKAYRTSN